MNAPIRHSDWVGELCIALAHRWEPERRFMILTSYLDESGTHGGDVTVMAGFLADARQWRKFEKRTNKLFARFRVDIFHTIDVKRTDKDFDGWTVDRKIEFLDEFHHIINETTELGYAAILLEKDYRYYLSLPWPKKARKDSRYTLLFRACMADTIDGILSIDRLKYNNEHKLNTVLESGHPNAPDALRLYNFFKDRLGGVTNRSMAGLTFEKKGDCLPLAAADLFAYSVHGLETGAKPIGFSRKPLKSEKSYPGHLHRLPLTQDVLLGLHEQAVEIATGRFS
ncbi:MAG: DUF3800 domain-containing protein [Xanthobacteraceae bacterium]